MRLFMLHIFKHRAFTERDVSLFYGTGWRQKNWRDINVTMMLSLLNESDLKVKKPYFGLEKGNP